MSDNREIVYVPPRRRTMWDAARKVAERKNISLSRLVNDALETHLPTLAAEPDPIPPDWDAMAAEPSNA